MIISGSISCASRRRSATNTKCMAIAWTGLSEQFWMPRRSLRRPRMAEVKRKRITEARYKKLVQMDPRRAYGCMINESPMTIRCQRIHDCRPVEQDGEFYIEYVYGG